jgi:hypothetical protein
LPIDPPAPPARLSTIDRLAQDSFQRQCHRPSREVGLAAGRKRHDHGNIARRPCGLRKCGIRQSSLRQRQRRGSLQKFTSIHRQFSPPENFVFVEAV